MGYDTSFEARSPGLVRMYMLIEELSGAGFRHIDLGKGVEEFKRHFSNGTTEVAEGSISGTSPLGLLVGVTSRMSSALERSTRPWRQRHDNTSGSGDGIGQALVADLLVS